ncbi:efflux RND transporter periplasmic adaptor subunit [Tepidimonas taiwanensis]|uniref:Multidrug resistance protein MdtA n=1 Tax=Tepidimonas taiwanensis TaxID=307486 RepID=A0A554X5K7_9BURK|nr:efflux RND transporter periplasmic adaptor subunit [Tepidimonas taiwanensis]MCX7693882.1 efflux RND transporter periplasmic adaptor subunit [Tepidimonas taiwanensis]MDM7463868.1 efflux RND transporter periplasmic adaptor subunit [Tepidimonas taiwanensis]TSE31097.1 Multidrug resistance protein MdtA [Tepidimonas taiwanensis]UBQ05244.1 efflux RND transporter periplasmic adaptor subunit [Tepidimonas taiwanensis]
MTTHKRWLAAAAVALVALAAAGWWFARATPVHTVVLTERPVQRSLVVTGRVAPARESTLASTVTGRVVATPVAEGETVRAGAVLVALEPDESQAALAQAEAQLADARGQLADAHRQWQRQRALQAQGFLSPAALEAAERTYDAARRRVEQTEAAVQQARARRQQVAVRAPAEGVVLTRLVEVGDAVTAGKAVARFAWAGPARVLLDLDERDVARVAVGQTAAVRADAWPDAPLAARVQRIDTQVDGVRGTVEVELALADAAAGGVRLLPGMTVSAEVVTDAPQPRLLLPLSALRDGRVATVVAGRVRWVAVETDPAVDGWLPVRRGLAAGVEVIDPAPALDDGARVEVRR